MTKVVHDTDIGSGLEISGGKLNAAGTMATDAEVAAAIAAADALEDAEDLAQLEAKLTKHIGGLQGDAINIGRRNIGVFEGLMRSRANNDAEGGFTAAKGATFNPPVGADASYGTVHFKLPWRAVAVNPSNQMYLLHFRGYAYLNTPTKKIIDFTASGYAYQTGLLGAEHQGSHASEVTQYVGSDGHVYVRLAIANSYYMTISIDSMAVGNGEAMPHDSITAHFDNAATL